MKRWVALETLNGEEDYFRILVGKIMRLKPTLIVVSKSICRTALQFFIQRGVTCVRNVKKSTLFRIARFTGKKSFQFLDSLIYPI